MKVGSSVISRDLASQLRLEMPLLQLASAVFVSCRRRNGCTSRSGSFCHV